jgi:hypothetical protein
VQRMITSFIRDDSSGSVLSHLWILDPTGVSLGVNFVFTVGASETSKNSEIRNSKEKNRKNLIEP